MFFFLPFAILFPLPFVAILLKFLLSFCRQTVFLLYGDGWMFSSLLAIFVLCWRSLLFC